jgi:hypothetical protein
MLDNALDCGISELDFWNMTIAELDRAVASRNRAIQREAKERASFDYILASLIGRAVSMTMSSGSSFPELHEVYPSIFGDAENKREQEEQKQQLSVLRFIHYAEAHNKNFKGVANNE